MLAFSAKRAVQQFATVTVIFVIAHYSTSAYSLDVTSELCLSICLPSAYLDYSLTRMKNNPVAAKNQPELTACG
jgi:hypothetical protein